MKENLESATRRLGLALAFAGTLTTACENMQQYTPTAPSSTSPTTTSSSENQRKKENEQTIASVYGLRLNEHYIDAKLEPLEGETDERLASAARAIVEKLSKSHRAYPDGVKKEDIKVGNYKGIITKGNKTNNIGRAVAYEWSSANKNPSLRLGRTQTGSRDSFRVIIFEHPQGYAFQIVERGKDSAIGNGKLVDYRVITDAEVYHLESGTFTRIPVSTSTFQVIK